MLAIDLNVGDVVLEDGGDVDLWRRCIVNIGVCLRKARQQGGIARYDGVSSVETNMVMGEAARDVAGEIELMAETSLLCLLLQYEAGVEGGLGAPGSR